MKEEKQPKHQSFPSETFCIFCMGKRLKNLIKTIQDHLKYTNCTICDARIAKHDVQRTRVARFGTKVLPMCAKCI